MKSKNPMKKRQAYLELVAGRSTFFRGNNFPSRGETSLEKAIATTVRAKQKDMAREYFDAFTLYMLALDYYQDAAKSSSDPY